MALLAVYFFRVACVTDWKHIFLINKRYFHAMYWITWKKLIYWQRHKGIEHVYILPTKLSLAFSRFFISDLWQRKACHPFAFVLGSKIMLLFFFNIYSLTAQNWTYRFFFQSFVITNHLAWLWFISHQLYLEWTIFKAVIQPLYTDFSIKNVLPFLSVAKGLPCQQRKERSKRL